MTNLKARAATERFTFLFENPEVTAMAAICEILQELPDDAARLRVMHWSFGRFNPEFKRPLPADALRAAQPLPADIPETAPQPAPALAAPDAVAAIAMDMSLTSEIAAIAPDMTVPVPAAPRDEDFGRQISELGELFSADICATPRRPIYADAF